MADRQHRYPADIRPLTSLRFYAAMTVVIYHFYYFTPESYTRFSGFFDKGYLAVDFFFILSGFILTHAYGDAIRDGTFSAWEFCVRRFARIYPMHGLMFLIMIPVALSPLHFGPAGFWPGHFPFGALLANILLVHGWGVERTLSFNLPSWSISAEWFAYLSFPLLASWLMARRRQGPALLAALALFFAMWFGWHTLSPLRPLTRLSADFSILRIAPEFTLGITLYLFCSRRTSGMDRFAGRGLAVCGAALLAMLHFRAPDWSFVPVFLLAIWCGAELSRRPDAGGWLARPLPVWLGEISYGIYMVHYVVMTLLLWSLYLAAGPAIYLHWLPVTLPAAAALSILAAAILHPLYEQPARRLLTRRILHHALARGRRTA